MIFAAAESGLQKLSDLRKCVELTRLELVTSACKDRELISLTCIVAGERRCGVPASDRDSCWPPSDRHATGTPTTPASDPMPLPQGVDTAA